MQETPSLSRAWEREARHCAAQISLTRAQHCITLLIIAHHAVSQCIVLIKEDRMQLRITNAHSCA